MAPKVPVIAIVGRPNVGKSTFFNRVYGSRKAIVEDTPGVTRDRNYALVERFQVPFLLVDTGGIDQSEQENDQIGKQVMDQALLAAEEADVLVVMFDGSEGCQEGDREVIQLLRPFQKKTYYVVNKCDGDEQGLRVADFYSLGVDPLYDMSALHGRRVSVFIEMLLRDLPNFASLLASANARRQKEAEGAREARALALQEAEDDLEAPVLDGEDDEDEFESDYEQSEFEIEAGEEEELEETVGREPQFAPVFLPDEENLSAAEYDRKYRHLTIQESVPRVEIIRDTLQVPEEELSADDEHRADNQAAAERELECIKVAIVGRPNAGKSTLLNTITGERRAITSPIAGTTRDNLDLKIRRDGQDYLIVDTAGLRKQGKVSEAIERYSTLRALGALAESDVAVVVIDAAEGPSEQDTKIIGLAHEKGAAIVLVVNKWDLVEKNHKTVHSYTEKIRETFKFAPYMPILYVCALSGRRCPRIIETVREVARERVKRVSTGELNEVLQKAIHRSRPAQYRGRDVKLYYGVQVDVCPPRFALFFNYPRAVHFSFLRYLKNSIRDKFGFEGTDIKLVARKR